MFTLHQIIKRKPVDLLIGNTYGKFIARAEDVPLVRVGFPIMDRANLHYFPIMGYAGAARLVERIGNTLLERKDRDAPDWLLETSSKSYFQKINRITGKLPQTSKPKQRGVKEMKEKIGIVDTLEERKPYIARKTGKRAGNSSYL